MRWFDKLGVKIMCDAQDPKGFKSGGFVKPEIEKLIPKVHEYLPRPSPPPQPKTVTEIFLTYLINLDMAKKIEYQTSTDDDGTISVVFKRIK